MNLPLALSALMALPATAVTIYSETVSGDLSGLIESPSSIGTLMPGENTVSGTINQGNLPFDRDTFTFTVAPDQILTSLSFILSTSGDNHFLGFSNETDLVADPASLLFATLIAGAQNGVNILPSNSDGGSFSGTGYTLPLPAGDYSLWFQETTYIDPIGFQEVDYAFTLTTVTVPEPSTSFLIALSSAFIWRRPGKARLKY